MKTINITFVTISILFLQSCEIFVIGTQREPTIVVDIDQKSPLGVVYVFKTELDSNNTPGAAQVLANNEGYRYLAVEREELYFEVDRMKRLIANRNITHINTDTIALNTFRYNVEFDYLFRVNFTSGKIGDAWYIFDYNGMFKQSYVLK